MQEIMNISGGEFAGLAAAGIGLAAVYLYLLWQTIKVLPRVRHKQLFLLASKIIRIALLLFPMVVLARHSAAKLLIIFAVFWLTRTIALWQVNPKPKGRPKK